MATNLGIDEKLLSEAVKAGGFKTKKSAVNQALKEFIERRKRKEILKVFGSVEMEPEYDYKQARRMR